MPFLVLDKDGQPIKDSQTGRIRHFDSRDDAEAYRKAEKAWHVFEVPSEPRLGQLA